MELFEFNLTSGGIVAINPSHIVSIIGASPIEDDAYGNHIIIKMSNGDSFPIVEDYGDICSRLDVIKKCVF